MFHPRRTVHSTRLPRPGCLSGAAVACALLLVAPEGGAQTKSSGSIYSCVDASGRTLTSDRPIPACLDREQREMSPNGTTRRRIEPNYTAKEQEALETRRREEAQATQHAQEERRRERALLMRYPNVAMHDRERAEALAQVDAVIQAARKRLSELVEQRARIDGEMEFYKKDPSKAPVAVRRQMEDNDQSVAVQKRFLNEQEEEKRRVNARFDDERLRLMQLWSPQNGGTAQR